MNKNENRKLIVYVIVHAILMGLPVLVIIASIINPSLRCMAFISGVVGSFAFCDMIRDYVDGSI